MKTLTVNYVKTVDTEYGPALIFSSKAKGEWKPKGVKKDLDISELESGKPYAVTFDDQDYWKVVKIAEPTFTACKDYNKPYDVRQAVSNAIAAAITAGKIAHPDEIEIWARATWRAVNGVTEEIRHEESVETKAESAAESKEESIPPGPYVCPECGAGKVYRSKFPANTAEEKRGWYCGECKMKLGPDDPRITSQYYGAEKATAESTEDVPF